MPFKPTTQQQAILDWTDDAGERACLVLEARAGCGKTFTLIQLVLHLAMRGLGNIFLGAFNRAIANEIKAKLAKLGIDFKTANAGTMHSAGLRAWRKVAPHVQVNGDKCRDIWRAAAEKKGTSECDAMKAAESFVLKLVSLAKQRVLEVDDEGAWFDTVEHFNLGDELPEYIDLPRAVRWAQAVFRISMKKCHEVVDFDDMIYAPLAFDAPCWRYDWVMIDEAQDTNPARRMLALKMLSKKGRMIVVGDTFQAIYGFTGADSDSMDLMADRFKDVTRLPLNFTFRCPHSVVREANQFVADLEAHPDNAEGKVETIKLADFDKEVTPTKEDAILCRNTAPLVEMAFKLIRRGIGCRVEGRDIGRSLVAMTKRWKSVKTLDQLVDKVEEYQAREVGKLMAKSKEQQAEQVADRCETLFVLVDAVKNDPNYRSSLNGLHQYIEALFGDTPPGQDPEVVVLSTIHRSKGREWARVFVLGANRYQPSPFAKKEWQEAQEANLSYVAITRAQGELVYIEVPLAS